jgi:hypothetical protein
MGCYVNRKLAFPLVLLFAVFCLSACSGLPKTSGGGGGGGGGTGGSVPVTFTLSSVPAGVPTGISILSFKVNISSVSITSQTNGAVATLTPSNLVVDLNQMLSESAYLGKITVGTDLYNRVQLAISSSTIVFCTSASGVAGCTPGSVKTVTGGAAVLPFSFFPALNAKTPGIGVRFRLSMSKALILNTAGTAVQSIDFTQPLVGFSEQLPLAANLASGQLDYVEGLSGVVTSVGASSVTLQTTTFGTITANVVAATSNFSTQNCATNDISCAKVNQVANMDTIVNADGTFTLLLFDPIDTASDDWIEGTVHLVPTSGSQFQVVVTNFVPAKTSSLFGANVHLGDQVTVNIANGTPFTIDNANLTVPANSFTGSQSTSVLTPGQVVAVRATGFTAASGATPTSVTVNALLLRFSFLSGLAITPGPNFPIFVFPGYFGISSNSVTQETTNVTNYELISSGAGTTLAVNQATGIRALYLGPPSTSLFVVAKVRQ